MFLPVDALLVVSYQTFGRKHSTDFSMDPTNSRLASWIELLLISKRSSQQTINQPPPTGDGVLEECSSCFFSGWGWLVDWFWWCVVFDVFSKVYIGPFVDCRNVLTCGSKFGGSQLDSWITNGYWFILQKKEYISLHCTVGVMHMPLVGVHLQEV